MGCTIMVRFIGVVNDVELSFLCPWLVLMRFFCVLVICCWGTCRDCVFLVRLVCVFSRSQSWCDGVCK